MAVSIGARLGTIQKGCDPAKPGAQVFAYCVIEGPVSEVLERVGRLYGCAVGIVPDSLPGPMRELGPVREVRGRDL